MTNIVNLDDYRKCNELEEEYLKFLTHVNKFTKIPTNVPELARNFYFILRYLEGTVNCLEILSIIKTMPEDEIEQMRTMVIQYMDEISSSLRT